MTEEVRKKGKKSPRFVPWVSLKNDYIFGVQDEKTGAIIYPTYASLGKKYNVSPKHIAGRATRENWMYLRKQHQDEVLKKAQEKTVELLSDRLMKLNEDALSGAQELLSIARHGIREYLEQMRAVRSEQGLGNKERAEILRNLAGAAGVYGKLLEGALRVGRLAAGSSTENVAVAVSDWRSQIIQAMREGILTKQEVEAALGPVAEELYIKAVRESDAQKGDAVGDGAGSDASREGSSFASE